METQALWTEDLGPQETEALLAKLAAEIRRRRLEAPAILLLETHAPFSRILGNAMIVFTPFLAPLIGIDNVHNASRLLMERSNVEDLIARLEAEPLSETLQEA
jgi:hypothetical protein